MKTWWIEKQFVAFVPPSCNRWSRWVFMSGNEIQKISKNEINFKFCVKILVQNIFCKRKFWAKHFFEIFEFLFKFVNHGKQYCFWGLLDFGFQKNTILENSVRQNEILMWISCSASKTTSEFLFKNRKFVFPTTLSKFSLLTPNASSSIHT